MRSIKLTKQFRKDVKRIKNDPEKLQALNDVLLLLRENGTLPSKYKPHILTGNYKGCMECHIGSDFLLIWLDEQTNVIKLLRLGSHAELFGM